MHIFLFILYLAVGGFAMTRIRFFIDSGIRPSMLFLLLGIRVAVGCLHNWVALHYFPDHGGDIWAFFRNSFITRDGMLEGFGVFVRNNSTWEYMPHHSIEILHVIFNFLSLDNIYINTLFFAFLVFWGSIALFRVFGKIFHGDLLCSCTALLLPSTLFWTASMHKEGFLFCLLGFFYYYAYSAIAGSGSGWLQTPGIGTGDAPIQPEPRKRIGDIWRSISFLTLIAFFRGNILFALLPALAIWFIATLNRSKRLLPRSSNPWFEAAISIIIIGGLVTLVGLIHPGTWSDLVQGVIDRQHDFLQLQGNSRLPLPVLGHSWNSWVHTLPAALLNGFFQPLPGSGSQALYLAFSIELLLIWGIVGWAILDWLFSPSRAKSSGLAVSFLVFAFLGMLAIGYTVPFTGAIVRYRSIFLPFLLAPFLHRLGHRRFFQQLNRKLSTILLAY